MKKTLIIIVLFLIQVQNSTVKCSPFLLKDSTKTEVRNSKIAAVFGIGLIGGVRLGVRYNISNFLSTELSYSPLNPESMLFAGDGYPLQLGAIINYKPFKKTGLIASLTFSYSEPSKSRYLRYMVAANLGYIFNYNKKGMGGFIRIGKGYRYKHVYYDPNYYRDQIYNIDFGIFYNF